MKTIKGKIRKMKQELEMRGIKNTSEEIRISYNLDTLVDTLNFLPPSLIQIMHKHILIGEALHVLAGRIEVCCQNTWHVVRKGYIVTFDPGEMHTIRTGVPQKPISFPGLHMNTAAAVVLAYKWLPMGFMGNRDDAKLVLENDWFPSGRVSFQIPLQDLKSYERNKLFQAFSRNKRKSKFLSMKAFTRYISIR